MNTQPSSTHSRAPDTNKPETFLVIVGAMKSGTTSLYRLLSQNPYICRSREKEPDFFLDEHLWKEGLKGYQALWDWNSEMHMVAMEASTSYSKYPIFPAVAERMANLHGAKFKLVYLLRNPLDRIQSHARHGFYEGWFDGLDLEDDGTSSLIECSKYATQIDKFMEYFSPSDLLLITHEYLKETPIEVMRKVCAHVGLDPATIKSVEIDNANDGTQYNRAQWVNQLLKSEALPAQMTKFALRSVFGRERLRGLLRSKIADVERGRYHLTAAERHKAINILRPDLLRLRDVYKIDAQEIWGIDLRDSLSD